MEDRQEPQRYTIPTGRAERSEHRRRVAEARGYSGPWPPIARPKCDTPELYDGILARVEAGETRSGLLRQLSVHTAEFFSVFSPERFREMALQIHSIAMEEEQRTSVRARVHAIRTAIRPPMVVMEQLISWQRKRPSSAGEHLEKLAACVSAYIGALGEPARPGGRSRIAEMSAMLIDLAAGQGGRQASVPAIEAALKSTVEMMNLYMLASAAVQKERGEKISPEHAKLLREGREELERIKAEIEGQSG